jgi:histidine kinase
MEFTFLTKDEKLLHESVKTRIFLRQNANGEKRIAKILNIDFPSPEDVNNFYKEYEILQLLPIAGVRKALGQTKEKNKHVLFFEYVEGQNLKEVFKNKQQDIEDFLHVSIAICRSLAEVHKHNVIHLDLNPFNLLVNIHQKEVNIIDFGNASVLDVYQGFTGNPDKLQGNLSYISPEQTGRMNRIVDYRSDLYSLGICFYEMLTGKLPFDAKEPIELVHAHIAQQAKPPHELNPIIPISLSNIVLKLLEKNAEDRYQSAFGVMADLEICLNHLNTSGHIPHFQHAEKDVSGRFLIPQKLYGREREIEKLIEAFERCAGGQKELMLITGYSGTGKTALVNETHKIITKRNGYFLGGKFEQYKRDVPYFALIEALKGMITILLSEKESKLAKMAEKIQDALGDEGKVLTNVMPNLIHIIGPQKDIPDLGAAEVQIRFNYLFVKFIQAICSPKHPLLIFIDDLQWADSASLALLEIIMTHKELSHFILVGAYRNNEVGASHPLNNTIKEISQLGTPVQSIDVGNLSISNIKQLIVDSTKTSPKEAEPLAELLFSKTQGNAFFTIKFLNSIAKDKLLQYHFEKRIWLWEIEKIKQLNISENVVEFISQKVSELDAEMVEMLKTGACIGNIFDLHSLSIITAKVENELKKEINIALREGMIVALGNKKYKFSHDRIQQAVYSLLSESEKTQAHLIIGQLLLENLLDEEKDERLFEIVNHLNLGLSLINLPEKRKELCLLNVRAGKKAKTNSAFHTSANYFETGISLLGANHWQNDYKGSLDLYSEACESAYLCGNFEKMDDYFRLLSANIHNVLDKVKPYEVLILGKKAQNKLIEAIFIGLDILDELGEPLPRKPNEVHIYFGLLTLMLKLRGRSMQSLLDLPLMNDPKKIAAMRILADITSSVYWAMPKLTPLVVFKMMNISMKYGNNAVSCFAYGSYGVLLCGILGQMKKGNEFGALSLQLLDKLDAKEWKAQIYVSPYALTLHWRNHIDVTLKPLRDSFHIGLETGLIEFACVNSNIYCIHAFLSGKKLVATEEETHSFSESYRQMKQETNLKYNEIYRQAMLNFLGRTDNPLLLAGDAIDGDAVQAQNLERNDKTGAFFIYFLRSMLGYFFRDFKMAYNQAAEARMILDAVLAKFEIPNHHFYEALAALEMARLVPQHKSTHLKIAAKGMASLKKWSADAPQNFQHKYHLVKAEWYRYHKNQDKALNHFIEAINGASDYDFTHEEALARELFGRFYLERSINELGNFYVKTAYNTYKEWGAQAKLNQLEAEFPSLFHLEDGFTSPGLITEGLSSNYGSSNLDISTFLKSATSISGEVVLTRLLRVLINNAIENAGAQRGLLLLNEEDRLWIEAELDLASSTDKVLQHEPAFGSGVLAESIVKYVNRTQHYLVLDNASGNIQFSDDSYVKEVELQSVLCLPVINQGKNIGILYLENRKTTGAFTRQRVELLSLLSSQMAISIDNARLYENLEQKVSERTHELSEEKLKSDKLLYNILPYETAQEIKKTGKAASRFYEMVSVLFTDFVDFTRISSAMTPDELVLELDHCFRAFDQIMDKHGIEKIKTIGDAYMAASGLPVPSSNHAIRIVKAAIDIKEFIIKRKAENGGMGFDIRIGVHSGPVIAGIVGEKKFQYDIWGDTVNIASRMESNSESGGINLSQVTYELIQDYYHCQYRGEIEAKGKGKMAMYFLQDQKNLKP